MVGHLPHAGAQDEISFGVWFLSSVLAVWMIWKNKAWLNPAAQLLRWCKTANDPFGINLQRTLPLLGLLAVNGLIAEGLIVQLEMARDNLDQNAATNSLPPDAQAGLWIRAHTDADAVVMARHVPTVFHYSQRKAIWFPPSTNPQLLWEGIQKHQVDFIVVVHREYSYYLPPEEVCFARLMTSFPDAFHLIYESPQFRIFRVVAPRAEIPVTVSKSDR
jgi:hypothetical protein